MMNKINKKVFQIFAISFVLLTASYGYGNVDCHPLKQPGVNTVCLGYTTEGCAPPDGVQPNCIEQDVYYDCNNNNSFDDSTDELWLHPGDTARVYNISAACCTGNNAGKTWNALGVDGSGQWECVHTCREGSIEHNGSCHWDCNVDGDVDFDSNNINSGDIKVESHHINRAEACCKGNEEWDNSVTSGSRCQIPCSAGQMRDPNDNQCKDVCLDQNGELATNGQPNFVNNDRGNNCYQNCQGSFIKENQSCNATCPAGATPYAYSDILETEIPCSSGETEDEENMCETDTPIRTNNMLVRLSKSKSWGRWRSFYNSCRLNWHRSGHSLKFDRD